MWQPRVPWEEIQRQKGNSGRREVLGNADIQILYSLPYVSVRDFIQSNDNLIIYINWEMLLHIVNLEVFIVFDY
jgi:hypothetical protein